MDRGTWEPFASSRVPPRAWPGKSRAQPGKEMGTHPLPTSVPLKRSHSRANACCNSQLHVPPPKWSMLNLQALLCLLVLPCDLCLPLKCYIVAMNLKLQIFSDLPHKTPRQCLWDGSSLDTLTHIGMQTATLRVQGELDHHLTTWSAVGQAGNTG